MPQPLGYVNEGILKEEQEQERTALLQAHEQTNPDQIVPLTSPAPYDNLGDCALAMANDWGGTHALFSPGR